MPQPNRRLKDREIVTWLRQLVVESGVNEDGLEYEAAVVDALPPNVAAALDHCRAKTLAGQTTLLLLYERRVYGKGRVYLLHDLTDEMFSGMKAAQGGEEGGHDGDDRETRG